MKLKINGFENQIDFNQDKINILEISDSKCFTHILQVINDKMNGIESNEIFLLNENDEILNMSKEIYLVFDIFNIDYSSKKVLNSLYSIIENNIKENQDYVIEELMLKIRNYLIEEINELPFEFVMKQELDITEILKLFGVKIDDTCYTSVLEKLEALINVIATLNLAKLLIIPNLKQYLSNDELIEFYKYSLYNNIKLFIIERKNIEHLEYESILKIDNEFDDLFV